MSSSVSSTGWDTKKDSKPFFLCCFYRLRSPRLRPKNAPRYVLTIYERAYQKQHPDLFPYGRLGEKPAWCGGTLCQYPGYLDAQVGKVLDKIKLWVKKITQSLFFTSDNGPVTREARKVYKLNSGGNVDGLRGSQGQPLGRREFVFQPLLNMVNLYHRNGFQIHPFMVWTGCLLCENDELQITTTDRTFDGESLVPVLGAKAFETRKAINFRD